MKIKEKMGYATGLALGVFMLGVSINEQSVPAIVITSGALIMLVVHLIQRVKN